LKIYAFEKYFEKQKTIFTPSSTLPSLSYRLTEITTQGVSNQVHK